MGRCVMDLGFFLTLAAALSGNFGIGPGFALADDASRRKAAPAIGANPSSPELIEAGVVIGPWRTPPDLEIKVAAGGAAIDGVIAFSGLPKALQSLNAECVQK